MNAMAPPGQRGQSDVKVSGAVTDFAFITQTQEKISYVLPSSQSEEDMIEAALLPCTCSYPLKLHKHPVITFSASKLSILLFQAFAFWIFISQVLDKQQSRAWER